VKDLGRFRCRGGALPILIKTRDQKTPDCSRDDDFDPAGLVPLATFDSSTHVAVVDQATGKIKVFVRPESSRTNDRTHADKLKSLNAMNSDFYRRKS